jgi:DNA-binding XRE family transcriptional regulator
VLLHSAGPLELSSNVNYNNQSSLVTSIRKMDLELSAAQSRAARALLNWSQAELAKTAAVAQQTVVDFERGARKPYPKNLTAMRRALEAAGVEFFNDSGVKLKAKPGAPSGSTPGGTRKPASNPGKPAAPRPKKPTASDRQTSPAGPSSKEAQIRALREQGAG